MKIDKIERKEEKKYNKRKEKEKGGRGEQNQFQREKKWRRKINLEIKNYLNSIKT